jgi:RNA polymerase sigma-70 factor (ECF subfamily)
MDAKDAYLRGRMAWSSLVIPEASAQEFLRERMPFDDERAVDLVLAGAVVLGVPGAADTFVATYEPHIRAIVARTVTSPNLREEACQATFVHLVAPGAAGEPPRLAGYRGHGPLLAFVRITAVRIALRLTENADERAPRSNVADLELAAVTDPELLYLRELYRTEFGSSFEAAITTLDKRERTLLRYQVVDRLSVDKIAAIYGIHRATAARRVADARAALAAATQRELMARLHVERNELDSILRLIESQIDVSVRRLLT